MRSPRDREGRTGLKRLLRASATLHSGAQCVTEVVTIPALRRNGRFEGDLIALFRCGGCGFENPSSSWEKQVGLAQQKKPRGLARGFDSPIRLNCRRSFDIGAASRRGLRCHGLAVERSGEEGRYAYSMSGNFR